MTQGFNIKQFFRRSPLTWLRRHFEQNNALSTFDWSAIKPRNVQPLVDAWSGLDENTQAVETTAKTHLQHIYAKTEVQADGTHASVHQLRTPRQDGVNSRLRSVSLHRALPATAISGGL